MAHFVWSSDIAIVHRGSRNTERSPVHSFMKWFQILQIDIKNTQNLDCKTSKFQKTHKMMTTKIIAVIQHLDCKVHTNPQLWVIRLAEGIYNLILNEKLRLISTQSQNQCQHKISIVYSLSHSNTHTQFAYRWLKHPIRDPISYILTFSAASTVYVESRHNQQKWVSRDTEPRQNNVKDH